MKIFKWIFALIAGIGGILAMMLVPAGNKRKKINNNIARNTKNTHTHNTPLLLPISLFGMHHSIPNNRRDDDR